MLRNTILFSLVFSATFFIYLTTYAQADQCGIDGCTKGDYCFVEDPFAGMCACFTADASDFEFIAKKGKKSWKRSVSLPADGDDLTVWLLKLASNKKNKISAADALFLERAIPAWNSAKRTIGMETTASGLKYKLLNKGDGKLPEVGKNVSVHYRGTLEDGTEFDNSYTRGEPISFPLGKGRVIKGWDEGIALLNVGSKALLCIPPELGYGARGAGGAIPPNATLYFEVELVKAD